MGIVRAKILAKVVDSKTVLNDLIALKNYIDKLM